MTMDLTQLPIAESVPMAARRALGNAQLLYDAAAVETAVDQLAVRLTVEWQDQDPLLITLLPQGLVLAGMLLRRLIFPCRHVTAVTDEQGIPAAVEPGRGGVVIIAGRLDGVQLERLRQWCEHHAVERMAAAVLAAPPDYAGDTSAANDFWPALLTDAKHLLGCGFDVAGYGANLPGLYQVAE